MSIDVASLPKILVGPVLRRVTSTSVAVWVALKAAPVSISFDVFQGSSGASLGGDLAARITRVGQNLYIVLLELTSIPALSPTQIYSYDITIDGQDLKNTAVFRSSGSIGLSYDHSPRPGLPSFVAPQTDLGRLKIAQGSCRKPHADSVDAFVLLDAAIDANTMTPESRPQQLYLTGDQIYADDVADSLLVLIQQVAAALIGAPPDDGGPAISDADRPAGKRAAFASQIGLTSEASAQKSHLLTFAEYCAMYLVTWSDLLWPGTQPNPQLSTFQQIYPGVEQVVVTEFDSNETALSAEFRRENAALVSFFRTLPNARRALANVATYMLFDDHEVCDDLFINRRWIDKITRGAGRSVVRNGLLSYAMFQALGNLGIESQFGPLLTEMSSWANSNFDQGSPSVGAIDAILAVPTGVPPRDGGLYQRPSDPANPPLKLYFRLLFDNYEVLALDTRTQRFYLPAVKGDVAPAQTISDGSLLEQIPGGAPAWKDAAEGGVTFVITPGPWTNLSAAEERQRGRVSNLKEVSKDSTAEKVFEDDVELIHFNGKGYDSLVARLAERAPNKGRVVILCGDVHFAFASRTQYWSKTKNPLDPGSANTPNSAVFAQMLASAFKNQGNPIIFSSLALHHAGFRLSKRDMMRVGWRVTGTDKFVAGTAQVPSTEGEDTVVWDIPVDLDHTAVTEFDVERSRFLSVTPSAAAVNSLAWQMHRVLYRGGDRGGPAEQVNGFIDFLAALWEVLTNWLTGYVGVKEAGREVVGVNNIGFLSLNWGIGESKSVFQQVTWFGAGRDALYAAQQVGTAKLLELKTWTQQEIPLSIEPQPNPPLSTVKF